MWGNAVKEFGPLIVSIDTKKYLFEKNKIQFNLKRKPS